MYVDIYYETMTLQVFPQEDSRLHCHSFRKINLKYLCNTCALNKITLKEILEISVAKIKLGKSTI